jgi:23S rRNA (cytidine1920-2'-O)/16S rRNA (cytidine1409-2'-O)-methyltransferase
VAKTRLDVALVERGLAETRAAAQRLVMAGLVFSGERRLDKAGQAVAGETPLEVRGQPHPYVSRGGLKLERALDFFSIPRRGPHRARCRLLDRRLHRLPCCNGARPRSMPSMSGPTSSPGSCAPIPRVVSMEKTNIRDITRAEIPDPIELIVCDASFIGLRTALPAALALAAPGAHLAALIKPQFEVGKGRVGKGGIVRDPALHDEVRATISTWLAETARLDRARHHRQPPSRARKAIRNS